MPPGNTPTNHCAPGNAGGRPHGQRWSSWYAWHPALICLRPQGVLWQTRPLPGTPWQLHLVHDTHNSLADSRWAGAAGAGGWLALALLVLFVRQRQRSARLRQRSRQELETVLQQHAQELRTAQDGIVQAAQQAAQQTDTGLLAAWSTCPRAWSSSTPT